MFFPFVQEDIEKVFKYEKRKKTYGLVKVYKKVAQKILKTLKVKRKQCKRLTKCAQKC